MEITKEFLALLKGIFVEPYLDAWNDPEAMQVMQRTLTVPLVATVCLIAAFVIGVIAK